jgi:formate dehydrogenase maturation protein FdhE
MDRADPNKRSGNEAQDDDLIVFCPTCASQPRLLIAILDSRKGKTVRLFECQCGEVVWDD